MNLRGRCERCGCAIDAIGLCDRCTETLDREGKEELQARYDGICTARDRCLGCPLSYNMPCIPPCKYTALIMEIREESKKKEAEE